MALDLGCDLMLVSSYLYYPRFSIGFLAFLVFGLSCLIAFLRLSSEAGLAAAWPPPVRTGIFFSKATSLETLRYLPE